MKTLACCILLFGLGLVSFGVLPTKAKGPSGYHVAKKLVLGGEGGWDYLTVDSECSACLPFTRHARDGGRRGHGSCRR